MLKLTDGDEADSWLFYCDGPATRCGVQNAEPSESDPVYGVGYETQCAYCHGSYVFTKLE
jgi:hypothetical protein